MHRAVLRRVFAKAVGTQRSKDAVEIIGAESKMTIGAVDVAGPERAGRIESQMHLQGTAAEPGAASGWNANAGGGANRLGGPSTALRVSAF